MTVKRFFISVSMLTCFALLMSGCFKVDTLPQFEIRVVDESGKAVAGAYVALFDSADEWNRRENPVQVWRRTDSAGTVIFADLKEITYYIYARFDGKDNSVGEVFTAGPLGVNQRMIVIVRIR